MEFSISGVLLLLLGILTVIEAKGYVEIKWISYYNRHGRTAGGKHCDRAWFGGKSSACDLKFTFKLNGKNSGIGPEWPVMKSVVYHEMDFVKFGSYFTKTMENPFKLYFSTWQGKLDLFVEVHDNDAFSEDDHVDSLRKTILAYPSQETRQVSVSSNVHGHDAKLIFTYKIVCSQFYYGKHCVKICKPTNDQFGHFKCDAQGNRRCLPGWKNPEKGCITKIISCDKMKCENGGNCLLQSDKPICNCASGYNGLRCQNAIFTSSAITPTNQEIQRTSQFNNQERKRNTDSSNSATQGTSRKPLTKENAKRSFASTRFPSTTRHAKDSFADKNTDIANEQLTTSNMSDSLNVHGFKVAANVDRKAAKQGETKFAGIHPTIFIIPLFLVILLLIGALYHQRQRLHKAFSIMKLSNSAAGNGAEVSNIYTEGLIEPSCEGRVRFVSNNTYNVDPATIQNSKKSDDDNGSLYGSISSKSDTDEEELMEEGFYSLPKDPKRYKTENEDNLTPPSLPPRDSNNTVSFTVHLPNHLEDDEV